MSPRKKTGAVLTVSINGCTLVVVSVKDTEGHSVGHLIDFLANLAKEKLQARERETDKPHSHD